MESNYLHHSLLKIIKFKSFYQTVKKYFEKSWSKFYKFSIKVLFLENNTYKRHIEFGSNTTVKTVRLSKVLKQPSSINNEFGMYIINKIYLKLPIFKEINYKSFIAKLFNI